MPFGSGHQSKKDRTYTAPPALAALSFVHKDAQIPVRPDETDAARYFMLAAAVGLVGDRWDGSRDGVPVQSAVDGLDKRAAGCASLDLQVTIAFPARRKIRARHFARKL
jgi:hypothetical protein